METPDCVVASSGECCEEPVCRTVSELVKLTKIVCAEVEWVTGIP